MKRPQLWYSILAQSAVRRWAKRAQLGNAVTKLKKKFSTTRPLIAARPKNHTRVKGCVGCEQMRALLLGIVMTIALEGYSTSLGLIVAIPRCARARPPTSGQRRTRQARKCGTSTVRRASAAAAKRRAVSVRFQSTQSTISARYRRHDMSPRGRSCPRCKRLAGMIGTASNISVSSENRNINSKEHHQ